ncbi:MAG TPA: DUF2442 domain-containing protein [Burkholderiaceae bacterium]|nr:DUF2442 domain-containing protein [Burkholderiaceae bacterium]
MQFLAPARALIIRFADQSAVLFPVKNYPELAKLTDDELGQIKLGLAGSALVLKACDLHVSIAGMVGASKPLMAVATAVSAARGGSNASERKVIAARKNGMKGGRPVKRASAKGESGSFLGTSV